MPTGSYLVKGILPCSTFQDLGAVIATASPAAVFSRPAPSHSVPPPSTWSTFCEPKTLRGTSAPHKAVINIYLGGGPSHQDMWEIKTEAPREIRGEFNPISTSVPGIQISEVFPRIAGLMHKCVVIRSVTGCQDRHDPVQCLTGYPFSLAATARRPAQHRRRRHPAAGQRRCLGAAVRRPGALRRSTAPGPIPARPASSGPPTLLSSPDGPGLENMTLNGITTDRLNDRRRMLASFDSLRRDVDFNATDAGPRFRPEPGPGRAHLEQAGAGPGHHPGTDLRARTLRRRQALSASSSTALRRSTISCSMARRLVEAGVRCVTLTFGRWDSHGQNFTFMRDHGGKLDQCLSALIEDLDVRGMLERHHRGGVGRIRPDAAHQRPGRAAITGPRSAAASSPAAACGTGQVIGSTNRLGEVAATRPVTHGEILATIYHNLGIAPNTTILDPTGRPAVPDGAAGAAGIGVMSTKHDVIVEFQPRVANKRPGFFGSTKPWGEVLRTPGFNRRGYYQ